MHEHGRCQRLTDWRDNPKQVYQCSIGSCNQSFVREDLFLRHRSRHQLDADNTELKDKVGRDEILRPSEDFQASSVDNATASQPSEPPLAVASDGEAGRSVTNDAGGSVPFLPAVDEHSTQTSLLQSSTPLDPSIIGLNTSAALSADNFASWLFGSPDSQDPSFNPDGLPFFDSGIDWSSWDFSDPSSSLQGGLQTTGATNGVPQVADAEIPSRTPQGPDHLHVNAKRLSEVRQIIEHFRAQRCSRKIISGRGRTRTEADDQMLIETSLPEISASVLQSCIASFWNDIAEQMPIVHRPTFSCSTHPTHLLLAMITLGAGQISVAGAKGALKPYANLANLLATGIRWEIFEDPDAHPPVKLWVAQALVLLEFYEKMYATRLLHERAHIGHSYTLNLLRRGSPMIAVSDSASPPDEEAESASPMREGQHSKPATHERTDWWQRWARNESMHRVVFAAFKMDILHAVMFGHNADLAPYEIRLPLPCDESMWTAESGPEVQRLQETFAFHGLKPVNFLDALKLSLHGQEVHTHFHGRTILFAGLLSIGWHISRREKSLQFLETPRSLQDQTRWQTMLSRAFDVWRHGFEQVLLQSNYRWTDKSSGIDDPNLLCHFANVVMHVDIVEVQIMAQNKRLLSRKVLPRDMALATQRMRVWAATATGRLAVFHAYRLLYDTIVEKAPARRQVPHYKSSIGYSCRDDSVVHWPWMIYLSALTVWSYEYCCLIRPSTAAGASNDHGSPELALDYLSRSKHLVGPDGVQIIRSPKGCSALLAALALDYANAESELFVEAGQRMRHCADMLCGH